MARGFKDGSSGTLISDGRDDTIHATEPGPDVESSLFGMVMGALGGEIDDDGEDGGFSGDDEDRCRDVHAGRGSSCTSTRSPGQAEGVVFGPEGQHVRARHLAEEALLRLGPLRLACAAPARLNTLWLAGEFGEVLLERAWVEAGAAVPLPCESAAEYLQHAFDENPREFNDDVSLHAVGPLSALSGTGSIGSRGSEETQGRESIAERRKRGRGRGRGRG